MDNVYGPVPTSIVEAAKRGFSTTATALIDRGNDVSETGQNGETALHWAAARGDMQLAQKLLDAGALVTDIDQQAKTPADLAKKYGHDALHELLENARQRELRTPVDDLLNRRETIGKIRGMQHGIDNPRGR